MSFIASRGVRPCSAATFEQGQARSRCLGGDIRDWPGIPSTELRPRIEVYAKAIDLLESLSIPTVAVIQGGCMGGGFELAMGCDLIVAAKSARFMFPEAMLGIMTLQGGVSSNVSIMSSAINAQR